MRNLRQLGLQACKLLQASIDRKKIEKFISEENKRKKRILKKVRAIRYYCRSSLRSPLQIKISKKKGKNGKKGKRGGGRGVGKGESNETWNCALGRENEEKKVENENVFVEKVISAKKGSSNVMVDPIDMSPTISLSRNQVIDSAAARGIVLRVRV